jgi:hypothetical protein
MSGNSNNEGEIKMSLKKSLSAVMSATIDKAMEKSDKRIAEGKEQIDPQAWQAAKDAVQQLKEKVEKWGQPKL